MITPEDIKLLNDLFAKTETLSDEESKLYSKVKLILQQIEVQNEMNEKILKIQDELKELEK